MLRKGTGDVAVFAPFTRAWAVARFFDSLAASDIPFERTRFVAYVDSADAALLKSVERRALSIPFAEVVIHCTLWEPPAEYAKSRERRGRHGAMRTASVGFIPKTAKTLVLLEDDTTVPADVWAKGTAALEAGYDWVSGFEVGRWSRGDKAPAGIWHVDGMTLRSMAPGDGLEECDSTGLYCAVTRPEVYAALRWDEWDNVWGHDVSIVWMLKQRGYRIGVDWSLRCIHMTRERDWTCDAWELYQRELAPLNPVLHAWPGVQPLTAFPEKGPRLARPKDPEPDEDAPRKFYRLAVDVEFEGREYPEGSRIDHQTAVAMSAAGVLKARIT